MNRNRIKRIETTKTWSRFIVPYVLVNLKDKDSIQCGTV